MRESFELTFHLDRPELSGASLSVPQLEGRGPPCPLLLCAVASGIEGGCENGIIFPSFLRTQFTFFFFWCFFGGFDVFAPHSPGISSPLRGWTEAPAAAESPALADARSRWDSTPDVIIATFIELPGKILDAVCGRETLPSRRNTLAKESTVHFVRGAKPIQGASLGETQVPHPRVGRAGLESPRGGTPQAGWRPTTQDTGEGRSLPCEHLMR